MSKKPFELHDERLGTTDQDGHRIYLFMDEVKGFWEKRRHYVYYFLMAIYLLIPWTKVGGKQTLFLNIAQREFIILGHSFYAHNIPLLFIFLFGFILSFGIITALWGRVWCGWACPQTVFIEIIFRKIETFIEGKASKRRSDQVHGKTPQWYLKKTLKWVIFSVVSMAIAHSFMAYFVGVEKLSHIVFENPAANWSLFITSVILASIVLFDFGWFREQFCIIMCPYGRIQSVFMDENSLVVGYDYQRGEPRGVKREEALEHGDCVDCYRCVQVCPTGIDIRRGTQLECIHCTRCIDACDEIMVKIKKPTGLIRYTTESELEGVQKKKRYFRVSLYGFILSCVIATGFYLVNQSMKLDVSFIRSTKDPYSLTKSEGVDFVINHFRMDLFYNESKELDLSVRIIGDFHDKVEVVVPIKKVVITPSKKKSLFVFFRAKPESFIKGSIHTEVGIYNGDELIESRSVTLLGPLN